MYLYTKAVILNHMKCRYSDDMAMARMNELLILTINNAEHQSYHERVCEGNDRSRNKHPDP